MIVDIPIYISDNLATLIFTYLAQAASHCVSFFSFDSHPLYSIVLFPASPFVDNILWLCHTSVLYSVHTMSPLPLPQMTSSFFTRSGLI